MINFNYEAESVFLDETILSNWLSSVIESENKKEGGVNFIFCDDEYLLKLNIEFLKHNTLTDIISFDYTVGNIINGDIFVSVERVRENAVVYNVSFEEEIKRVMVHGILHLCGYKDKNAYEQNLMRQAENNKLAMFHVKH